jgi:choline dehydrogenase
MRRVIAASLLGVRAEGVRVADASTMPFVTTGNTHAPALMIGARAAAMLLAAASNRR